MNAKELRQQIQESCETHDSLYGQLVKPINDMLIDVDANISEETAHKILENLKAFHAGEKAISDCHLDESNNFLNDGMADLQAGHLADGAIQIFGAGLNFASFASKADPAQGINPHHMLDERFKKLKQTLDE